MYLQDDVWSGVSTDHLKIWTIDVDWETPDNSTISDAQELETTPFDGLFDGGSFSNLHFQSFSGNTLKSTAGNISVGQ